jgi:pilus assembly protein Flp/PilA
MRRPLALVHVAAARWYSGLQAERLKERGATAVEYALIMSLIAIVIIVAVVLFGTRLSAMFNRNAASIPT